MTNRPLKNVGEAGKTRQKRPKKRSLRAVNEHFEAVFNAVLPTQVVFQRPAKPFTSYLPSHDGQSSAAIEWPWDCRQAFDKGVSCAQAWLSNDDTGWLWANLIVERDALPAGLQRRAFEVGFLSRVHQRLCSPFGGGHQARQTCLQL